jgi:hypothetical protein
MKRKFPGKERRRQPRFKVSGTVIALAGPQGAQRGKVTEISRTSLSFQCHKAADHQFRAHDIDIIWSDFVTAYHLQKLPVRKVSDVALEAAEKETQPVLCRTTVAFTNLSPVQESLLTRLITSCGIGAR